MKDERELVAAMLAGDERAFTTFFETYFPRVYRFALPRMNRNADATKDVVQATLVKAMRAVGDWRGEAALFTWLCQICRRQIADHVRSERRHASKVVLIDDSEEVRAALESIAAPSTDDPLHGADRAELGRLVHAVLDRLPVRRRTGMEIRRRPLGRRNQRAAGNRPDGSAVAAGQGPSRVPGRGGGRVRRVGRRCAREPRGMRAKP